RAPDRELGDRDDAFRLVADVDEHLVLVHPDDGAVDDLPLVDRREGRLVVGDQLAVGTRCPDAVACNWLLSVGSHMAADQYSQRFPAENRAVRLPLWPLATSRILRQDLASCQSSPAPISTANGGS